jgi:hypothetical protein
MKSANEFDAARVVFVFNPTAVLIGRFNISSISPGVTAWPIVSSRSLCSHPQELGIIRADDWTFFKAISGSSIGMCNGRLSGKMKHSI